MERAKMNKIAVNPTQFVTCRLCLEELGLYQIVPSVKEQIEYCFGIQVELFDGLSQLICQKCETILNNYTKIKKKYIDKQAELRTKIFKTQSANNGELSCAQETSEESRENLEIKCNTNIPQKRRMSTSESSSDMEYNKAKDSNRRTHRRSVSNEEIDGYTKKYVCRVCSSRWTNVNSVQNHINRKHNRLYKKYGHILKSHCQVKLCKIDGEHSGFSNKIVYSRDKIVRNVSEKYFIMYTTDNHRENDTYDETRKNKHRNLGKKYNFSSDSSDEELIIKRKKRNRVFSRSSSETVVLDNKSNTSDNENKSVNTEHVPHPTRFDACINLDDSSEGESGNSVKPSNTQAKAQTTDVNCLEPKVNESTIVEVINLCANKYNKKHYHDNLSMKSKNYSDIATHLKRKILSIGRKVMNKKLGVNCTPLLRFLVHKNLEISWIPRELIYVNADSNYVRILPRMKHVPEKVESETGWTHSTQTYVPQLPVALTLSRPENNSTQVQIHVNALNGIQLLPTIQIPSVCVSELAVISEATLGMDTMKLLNANPVANPKQLPKKLVTHEIKAVKTASKPTDVVPQENNDVEMCMPIITSTTSLAEPFLTKPNDPSNKPEITSIPDDQKSEAPRIKVKPVSELMSAETLNRMQSPVQIPFVISQPLSVQNQNKQINVFIPRVTAGFHPPQTVNSTNGTANLESSDSAWEYEYMILDTIELPNTRTNSPFLYFRNLLQIHNIILLDTHTELNTVFHCLIKFKVVYNQDSRNQPVMLCLALFCAQNVFCFKIKDRNQDNIDLTKVTSNWQWEVLKIYKGEVVQKMLTNAEKIGPDVYEYTNKFICLLKSIKLVRIES